MPTQVIWDNPEKTIIRHIYTGHVSTNDYKAVALLSANMLNTVSHLVDVIIILNDVRPNIDGFLRGSHFANKIMPVNQRLVVIVNADVHLQGIVKMASKFTPKIAHQTQFVDTIEEAYQLIAKSQVRA